MRYRRTGRKSEAFGMQLTVQDDVRAALRTRRNLSKEERQLFEEPKAIHASFQNLLHWTVGVIVQDQPALVAIAVASSAYSVWSGIVWSLQVIRQLL